MTSATTSLSTPAVAYDVALLRISKADKKTLQLFAEGVYLTQHTSRDLGDLQDQACADRIKLARSFLVAAEKLSRLRPPQHRSAISRYYYAMYHATRAVVYYAHGGDDHEAHKALPAVIPQDFQDAGIWQNTLKDARNRRNEADYDPYPTDGRVLRQVVRDLANKAPQLIGLAEQYLRAKGCAHL